MAEADSTSTTGAEEQGARDEWDSAAAEVAQAARELSVYGRHFLESEIDVLLASIKRRLLRVVLGVAGLVLAASLVLAACVALAFGLVNLLTIEAGLAQWLSGVVVGAGMLVGLYGSLWAAAGRHKRGWGRRLAKKYQREEKVQLQKLGTNTSQKVH